MAHLLTPENLVVGFTWGGLIFCIIIHEIAHGATAWYFGDDTAREHGRLSLNPIVHIDPMMTIILPALMLYASGGAVAFGVAKPVPVNVNRLRHPRWAMLAVAAAGPLANMLLAVLFAGILSGVFYGGESLVKSAPVVTTIALNTLLHLVQLNVLLALFNLLPVPPLDGSKIVGCLLPPRLGIMFMSLPAILGLVLIGLLVTTGTTNYLMMPVMLVSKGILRLVGL